MKIRRAAKYGFCAGVRIADKKVKKFAREGNRGSILGQVVHNERVVDEMAQVCGVTGRIAVDVLMRGAGMACQGRNFEHRARAPTVLEQRLVEPLT